MRVPSFLAGLALAGLVAAAASLAAGWIARSLPGIEGHPVSPVVLAIVLGMLIANLTRWARTGASGLRFASTTILRLGIVLLGFRLSLLAAGQFTLAALPFVLAAIAAGVGVVRMLGPRLGLTRTLAGLIAVGTSICGATAIVATAPLIRARQAEVGYAVTCITVFGIAAMFGYPVLAHAVFVDRPELAGMFLGASIHETAQVAGAGVLYEARFGAPAALEVATVTKLVRNLSMLAMIPLAGVLFGAARRGEGRKKSAGGSWVRLVPWFVVGFAACSALRTLGDHLGAAGLVDPALWGQAVGFLRHAAELCLLLAMAAVGLGTSFGGLRRIGLRPFLFGLFAAVVVGAVSLALIAGFGPAVLGLVGA